MVKVLFVCLGNICRSPTAEGVFRHLVSQEKILSKQIEIDSAGTAAYHKGEPPDVRAQQAAKKRGIDLSRIRARGVQATDFESFDLILAMDKANLQNLRDICPEQYQHKIQLFLSYSNSVNGEEVPDPYYGHAKGFEHVLDLVEAASQGLIASLKTQL